MRIENILIIIAAIIILTFVLVILFKARKRKKIVDSYKEELDKIDAKQSEINIHLERTNKIAKNDESRELFNLWVSECKELDNELSDVKDLYEQLVVANTFKSHKTFVDLSNTIDGFIFDLESRLSLVDKKISHYTEFEMDNSRISLSLKGRIKEITSSFNSSLKHLEIYTNSFNQQITDAQIKINEFENLQKDGEYVEGRTTLKECNLLIDHIQHMLKIILNFQEYLTQLDADIKITFKIRNEVKKIGFELNINDFDAKMNGFMEKKDHLIAEITKFNFDTILDPNVREQLHGEVTELDTQITQFKDIIEEKFTFISEIIALKDNNSKLIEVTKILIDGARDEKDSIIKLYELSEIKQLTKIDDEINLFNSFLNDYDKLIEIIYSAREDYASLKARITQANKFLIRVIKNLEVSIKELKAIRSDELSCRDRIIDFDLKVVEIDLYIRKYQHTYKTSSYINAMIEELNNKLTLLKKELNNEPLNITTVRNLNDSVASIINKLTEEELEKNIKQRIGSELILKYISRFNKSEGMDTTIGRLNNLYSGHEYKALLQEGYQILLNADSIKGPAIYKGIVSEVSVEPFNEILSIVSSKSTTEEVPV